ncbi:unnamed protein product [Soboliphyme baturini]|uniref:G_PROTEIN_RECEP_F1_2 domain-containing protein n=1 Tax=Soboliphyme baturini TaxID=241478 RepID=A0A183IJR3_9BILA|nr:unnamed protein product [Soboliphyme baturini]
MSQLKATPYCLFNSTWDYGVAAEAMDKFNNSVILVHFDLPPAALLYAGWLLAACSFVGLGLHIHIIQIICQERMWITNSYLIWFVSQSAADIINLTIYVYGASVVLCSSSVGVGKIINLVYHLRLFHYPFIIITRFLGVLYPHWYPYIAEHTLHIVFGLWLLASLIGFLLVQNSINWLYFHPLKMNWVLLRRDALYLAMATYWTVLPVICGTASLALYLCCVWILARRAKRIKNTSVPQTRQAGKNLIVVGLTTSVILLLDTLFWRINVNYSLKIIWWSSISLSFIEVVQSSSDALLILLICHEIRSKSFIFKRCFLIETLSLCPSVKNFQAVNVRS